MRATTWPSILVATTNPGKLREITQALDGLPVSLCTLADVAAVAEPAETGSTFAENALIKARAYAYATRLPTVADDSGLAIDALGGRPGVHSARYPGDTYAQKFENLFRELTPHRQPWPAQFVCALAFVDPAMPETAAAVFACEGVVAGEITQTPRGTNGFGYDPIFYYPPYDATLAEVDTARKLSASHRGAAFRQFRDWLTAPSTGFND